MRPKRGKSVYLPIDVLVWIIYNLNKLPIPSQLASHKNYWGFVNHGIHGWYSVLSLRKLGFSEVTYTWI